MKLLRKLANEYTVIAEKPEKNVGTVPGTIVLCAMKDRGYAIWWCRTEDNETFHGEYFPFRAYMLKSDSLTTRHEAFMAAVKAFDERESYYA